MYTAVLTYKDENLGSVLEAEESVKRDRSTVTFSQGKITITAQDAIALKSHMYGVIKLIEAYEKTSKVIDA